MIDEFKSVMKLFKVYSCGAQHTSDPVTIGEPQKIEDQDRPMGIAFENTHI